MDPFSRPTRSSDEDPGSSETGSDLNFAESNDGAAGAAARPPKHIPASDQLWQPSPQLPQPAVKPGSDRLGADPDPDAPTEAGDTWVPNELSDGDEGGGDAGPALTPADGPVGQTPDIAADQDIGDVRGAGSTWVPGGEAVKKPEEKATTNALGKSWPFSQILKKRGSDESSKDRSDAESPGVGDTWVPDMEPSGEGSDHDAQNVSSDDDTHKTWSIDDIPTLRGVDDPPDENLEDRPRGLGDTWVPGMHATTDGSIIDPRKTQLPSDIPTVHGLQPPQRDVPAAKDPDIDLNRTWVPATSPTHHEFSFDPTDVENSEATSGSDVDDTSAADDDPNKTWVATATPTQHHGTAPGENTQAGESNPDMDSTDVFCKTMGMRGQSEDEYQEWRQDVADAKPNSTEVVPIPKGTRGGVSPSGRGTQIWSRASSGQQDLSLTIRHRPVAGDDDFQQTADEDQPDYQILEKLAEGGMGTVFIARQTSLDRELAIKTLKPLKEQEQRSYTRQGRMDQVQRQRREMFLSEALVTANLVHPHIIPIHDLCQTVDGSPFYSMKRVNGIPWNERITRMSLEENLEVLHKVCDAIAYAHHHGVVNRDLKPENIMLGEFGEVLVLDWGLAAPASKADKSRFRSPSAPFGAGTPAYMAPELWTGPADAIGTWSDIYLLGAILFEALTGKTPHTFPETDPQSGNTGLWNVIDGIVRKNEIRPSDVRGELMDIALQSMATDPADRYDSVLDFQEAVKEFERHEESRRLARRAHTALTQARQTTGSGGYQGYQTAAALFEEAHAGWPQNHHAKAGLTETRLAYAGLAHDKGDYDLGLQVAAQEDGLAFSELTQKLSMARRRRSRLKNAMLTTSALIVISGIVGIIMGVTIRQQNKQIIALHGTTEQLETQKTTLERQSQKLVTQQSQLVSDNQQLEKESQTLQAANAGLQNQNVSLAQQTVALKGDNAQLLTDNETLMSDKQSLIQEQQSLKVDKQKLSTEIASLETDTQRLTTVVEELQVDTERLTEEKIRAGIELRNADIANLIRNADYSAALRQIETLLTALDTDADLSQLPATEREQRRQELRARERQLQKRVLETDVPVQQQVISRSGNIVVWGDHRGRLSLRELDSAAEALPANASATLNVQAPISSVNISQDEHLIVAAAGTKLHLWTPSTSGHQVLTGHAADIKAVQLTDEIALSADVAGVIIAWNLATREQRWSMRSTSAIRDLAVLPAAGIFLYAGSRGGESADVLAYQLPPETTPNARPQRLGQLQFPRDRNHPPQRIAVSPDEQWLLVSNSRNGDVLMLPRRPSGDRRGKDRFPFVHAADLAQNQVPETQWLLSHHQRPVNDITFSTDGNRIATASDDRSIGIWQRSSSTVLDFEQRLEGHGARVHAAGFLNPSGTQVLSAGADRFCRLWDVTHYQERRREIEAEFDLNPVESSVQAAAGVGRQRYLLTGWPKEARPAVHTPEYRVLNSDHLRQRGGIRSVAISGDGTRLVTGAADGTAVIWNTETGTAVTGVSNRNSFKSATGTFTEGHEYNVARMRFLPPNGATLLTTGFDGHLCLWNANIQQAGPGGQQIRLDGLGVVNAMATSSDGTLIVVSAAGDAAGIGNAMVFRTSELLTGSAAVPTVLLQGFHQGEVGALAVSPDGTRIATGARDGRVAVWAADSGMLLAAGRPHTKNTIVGHLEWLSDARLLSAGYDGALLILTPDVPSGIPTETETTYARLQVATAFQHDPVPIERLAVSSDRRRFVTISVRTDTVTKVSSYELELWDMSESAAVRRLQPALVGQRPVGRIAAVDWSRDGRRLVAVVDGNLQVFETDRWRVQNVLEAPGLGISDAVFAVVKNGIAADSPDVIATFDGTAAHLWDLKTHRHLADFRPLTAVQATALSDAAEQRILLTGDRAIRVFQAASNGADFGDTLFKISDPHAGIVTSLQFSPDAAGGMFVSAGADGTAAIWKWNSVTFQATLVKRFTAEQLQKGNTAVIGLVAAAWSNDGRTVLLAAADGRVNLINCDDFQQPVRQILVGSGAAVELSAAAFSSNGRFMAVGGQIVQSGESAGWIYDLQNPAAPELHCDVRGHEAGGIRSLTFLPDSPYLVTGGFDGAALIWNWQPARALEGPLQAYEAYQLLIDGEAIAHPAPINATAVTSTGLIATASEDGTAILWNNPFVR